MTGLTREGAHLEGQSLEARGWCACICQLEREGPVSRGLWAHWRGGFSLGRTGVVPKGLLTGLLARFQEQQGA